MIKGVTLNRLVLLIVFSQVFVQVYVFPKHWLEDANHLEAMDVAAGKEERRFFFRELNTTANITTESTTAAVATGSRKERIVSTRALPTVRRIASTRAFPPYSIGASQNESRVSVRAQPTADGGHGSTAAVSRKASARALPDANTTHRSSTSARTIRKEKRTSPRSLPTVNIGATREERRSFVKTFPWINITYERLADNVDGRYGAVGPNGEENYVFDPTSLRRNPPVFFPSTNCSVGSDGEALRKVVVSKGSPANSSRSKILCFIYSYEGRHETRIQRIRETWGQKFDGFGVASTNTSLKHDAVLIPHKGPEEYENMWQKVRSIWIYIYENYYNDYDWFYMGGDDMLIIVENLRSYLDSEEIIEAATFGAPDKDHQRPLYLGKVLACGGRPEDLYNTGGPGYLLNKAAVKLLVTKGLPIYQPDTKTSAEDLFVAQTLRKFHVLPYNTTDVENRARFMHLKPVSTFCTRKHHGGKRMRDHSIIDKDQNIFLPRVLVSTTLTLI